RGLCPGILAQLVEHRFQPLQPLAAVIDAFLTEPLQRPGMRRPGQQRKGFLQLPVGKVEIAQVGDEKVVQGGVRHDVLRLRIYRTETTPPANGSAASQSAGWAK